MNTDISRTEISTERQQAILAQLRELVADRAATERSLRDGLEQQRGATTAEFRTQSETAKSQFSQRRSKLESDYLTQLAQARVRYDRHRREVTRDESDAVDDLMLRQGQAQDGSKNSWRMARERIAQVYTNESQQHEQTWQAFSSQVDELRGQWESVLAHFDGILKRRRGAPTPLMNPTPIEVEGPELIERHHKLMADSRGKLKRLGNHVAARFLEDGWPILLFLLLAALLSAAALQFMDWRNPLWAVIAGAVAAGLTFVACRLIRPFVARQTTIAAPAIQQDLVDAESHLRLGFERGKRDHEAKRGELIVRRDEALVAADLDWSNKKKELDEEFGSRISDERETASQKRASMQSRFEQQAQKLNAAYRPLIDELETAHGVERARRQTDYERQIAEIQSDFDSQWRQLVDRWQSGLAEFDQAVEDMNVYCDRRFPDWRDNDWSAWRPPAEDLLALRFGHSSLRLDAWENGVPEHADLAPPRLSFDLPAVLSFPTCPSLLFKAHNEGRDRAVETIQNVMLRMLTSFPPGKVRFTIIDPTGLGQNFSAFMHLADYDERFVTNRIWTESSHINQRLADLTEHMENVIQKYLRNQFESIQEYNQHAGEVAEPFQILVVANFPTNFSEEATRRLVSIASSGARCGVYTLISVDTKMKAARNFDVADLEAHAATLQWNDERFEWAGELQSLPLTLASPPDDALFSEIVHASGELAQQSSRVEVPFSVVAPDRSEYWTADSRGGLRVPLGRAGATKLQRMELGRGTSQHVLISGKTGSGKSTLLHALITNLALYYSPSEVQLYLIDFKKGVEFKPYASMKLPHACVIAIESEREFGMSVLERLDVELKQRGDLFRAQGVQDVKGYRDAFPEAELPRIMLIIDEFQEFFVKDDKIAQEAGLLLDRLVRQGRAFGIHVLLGSQTLSGAYSLARSTIGQMAVRIALQCSEGDAHLILSEDNTAARLLNRPGEAIYNDANGMFEGNNPFQVVWLPDQEREKYLRDVAELAENRGVSTPPPIVFEGNVPADLGQNALLERALQGDASNAEARAWLGSAVAIKDPTSVTLRRQSGANLLIVGQQDEPAMSVAMATIVGLAANLPNDERRRPRFVILDGARPDGGDAGYWNRFASSLPIDAKVMRPRDAAAQVGELADELDRRMEAADDSAPSVFLTIHNLARFRDLKRSDDMGFSFDEDKTEAAADKQLAHLLREGPNFGIHCVIWCDSYNNAMRWFDRQSLRDLELRVLFQMSASDSSNLMETPAAAKLGANRAMLYSEELGEFEKFRPYGPPDPEWLAEVALRLNARTGSSSVECTTTSPPSSADH